MSRFQGEEGKCCQRSLLAIECALLEAVCAAEEMKMFQKMGVLHELHCQRFVGEANVNE